MTIKVSGPLSLSDIKNEFGSIGTTLNIDSYYRNGGLVPEAPTNDKIPAYATPYPTIKFSDFYGAQKATALNITISNNTPNVNMYTLARSNGWTNTATPLVYNLTINAVVYSNSISSYALDTGSGYPAGSVINIINNNVISGHGGTGGKGGGGANSGVSPSAGSKGGPAFIANTLVNIWNNGTIGGGGGGGGGGSGSGGWNASGGGGGGGAGFGAGAARQDAGVTVSRYGGVGGTGSSTNGGNGGNSGDGSGTGVGAGGGGGGLGSKGGNGGNSGGGTGGAGGYPGHAGGNGPGGAASTGGAAGVAITNNGNITWKNSGSIYG